MAGSQQMEPEVFLDTAYAIALSSRTDQYHDKAVELARQLKEEGTKLVTTRAVLLEIGNALSGERYRTAAVRLLEALEADPDVGIVPLTESLYAQAVALFRDRPDKEWGLTDCVSFVVMRERRMRSALTTDDHFAQAGYQVLLRESK
jgi:predicted nucleic acid-binding protein